MAADEPKHSKPVRAKKATKPAATRVPSPRKTAAARVTTAAAQSVTACAVTYEQVAFRAYELYEFGAPGDALEHWLTAERELLAA